MVPDALAFAAMMSFDMGAKSLVYRFASLVGRDSLQPFWGFVSLGALAIQGIGTGSSIGLSGERKYLQRLKQRVQNSVCIDAGGHHGEYAALLTETFGQVPIHIFEPSRTNQKILRERFRDCSNVVVNPEGLSDRCDEVTLFSTDPGSAIGSLYARRLDHFGETMTATEGITTTTLDVYCEKANIKKIGLLKLDIEGHELAALHGAEGLLAKRQISVIQFEFGGCNIDSRTFFQDFWYLLAARGFLMHRLLPSGQLHRIAGYKEIHEQFRTTNFVALLS